MNPLPLSLTRKGVYYSQVKRSQNTALYALQYAKNGRIVGYDAFKVQCVGERSFKGKTLPRGEQFPANSDYGSTAFSYSTIEVAEKKYQELNTKAEIAA